MNNFKDVSPGNADCPGEASSKFMKGRAYENKDKNVDYNVENKEETRMRYYFEKEYNSKNIGLHIPLYL